MQREECNRLYLILELELRRARRENESLAAAVNMYDMKAGYLEKKAEDEE